MAFNTKLWKNKKMLDKVQEDNSPIGGNNFNNKILTPTDIMGKLKKRKS